MNAVMSNEYIKIDSLHTGPWCDCTLRHKLCVRRSIEKISTFVSTLTKIGYFKYQGVGHTNLRTEYRWSCYILRPQDNRFQYYFLPHDIV